jgi:acetoin utilization protein AcuB
MLRVPSKLRSRYDDCILQSRMGSTRTRRKRSRHPKTTGVDQRVARYMSAHPQTIGVDQPLSVAHTLMRRHRIRHLPVLAEGRLVGLVSMEDLHLMETLRDVGIDDTLVEEAMATEPYAVDAATPVEQVAVHMAERRLSAAVITFEGQVVGIFTDTDALRALASLLPSEPSRDAS